MAFTQASQVASLIRRHVLDDVKVSIGRSEGIGEYEIVVRGYRHPEDGLTRQWLIDVIGPSGDMLDLILVGLRKAGFELTGSAPLLSGVLTEMLSRAEVSAMQARERKQEDQKKQAQFKAELQAETLVARQDADSQIELLKQQLEALRQQIEDLQLLPRERGPAGPPGPAGADGKDGNPLQLEGLSISDFGDVSDQAPEEMQVLTWKENEWQPLYVPKFAGNVYSGGGGGGGSLTVQTRANADGEPDNISLNINTISFNTNNGFNVTDLGDGEAFVTLGSAFAPWHVEGQETLDPEGEEPVEFVAGPGITITTDPTAYPQQIKIEGNGSGGGGIPEAPIDGNQYARQNGSWTIVESGGGSCMIDGGNFDTGESLSECDGSSSGGGNSGGGGGSGGGNLGNINTDLETISDYPEHYANVIMDLSTMTLKIVEPIDVITPE